VWKGFLHSIRFVAAATFVSLACDAKSHQIGKCGKFHGCFAVNYVVRTKAFSAGKAHHLLKLIIK